MLSMMACLRKCLNIACLREFPWSRWECLRPKFSMLHRPVVHKLTIKARPVIDVSKSSLKSDRIFFPFVVGLLLWLPISRKTFTRSASLRKTDTFINSCSSLKMLWYSWGLLVYLLATAVVHSCWKPRYSITDIICLHTLLSTSRSSLRWWPPFRKEWDW